MAERTDSVVWTEDLATGNEEIDLQHQYMFGMLNDLINTCEEKSGTEKQLATLDFLCEYIAGHLKDEEALQVECGYPDYERHKRLHENFTAKVGGLIQKFTDNGASDDLNRDIVWTILTWLEAHIWGEDKKIAEYIRAHRGS